MSTCGYVDYLIYPTGLNVSHNEDAATAVIAELESYGSFISQECQDAVKRYTCGFLYSKCASDIFENATSSEMLKPCLQMCLNINAACEQYKSYLSPEELAFINCTQTIEDGSPRFSNSSDCYYLENLTPIGRCSEN